MGKGDKKSKKGKISMGSFGNSRPRKKKPSYKFVPRGKKESASESLANVGKESAAVDSLAQSVKPKKKTAAKAKTAK